MKAATLHELKNELDRLERDQLKALCLRLAKFKKENKELLTYLLFESQDEQAYLNNVIQETTEQFNALSNLTVYYVKKSVRRILRMVNKHIKYSGILTTELALRIHFCLQMKEAAIPMDKSVALKNIQQQQLKKIHLALSKIEEDLRYDYQSDIDKLT